jgi:deoxyribodipyrimidine photo-lyase
MICLHTLGEAAGRAIGGAARWWLAQSLRALGQSLTAIGGSLVLRKGPAARIVPDLARERSPLERDRAGAAPGG